MEFNRKRLSAAVPHSVLKRERDPSTLKTTCLALRILHVKNGGSFPEATVVERAVLCLFIEVKVKPKATN